MIFVTCNLPGCVVLECLETAQAVPSDPEVDPATGEWILSVWDVECLALGAGIIGCGGGGSPHMGKLRVLRKLEEGKKIRILNPFR